MKLPETPQACLLERDKWEGIINSPEWVAYRNLLKEHLAYLQKKVNDNLREQKNVEAYGFLIAMDDSKKILDLVTTRISDLNLTIERGGK